MAVTITVNQLAVETRVNTDSAVPPPEPWGTILTRQLAVATSAVEGYAPDAPEDVQNEAVVLIAGYSIESPHVSLARTPGATLGNVFSLSGAKGILAPYRELTSAKVS